MSITVNWATKTVLSTANITDLPVFKEDLRLLEESAEGILYPPICTYKRLDLGGGGYFHAVDFINGYVLEFVGAGPFTISGNLNCTINDTGVQVERKTSAAYATSTAGGGVSAEDIAAAVLAAATLAPIAANLKRVADSVIAGAGTTPDPWRPA